jgi:DNA-binding transcriptional ArsR family regulator
VIAGWAVALDVAIGIGIIYLIITRRGTGATAGEALLRTTYISRHHRAAAPAREGAQEPGEEGSDLVRAATLLRLVADVDRLRILRLLLGGEHTSGELARDTGLTVADVVYHLGQLWRARLVVPTDTGRGEVAYMVPSGRPREVALALLALAAAVEPPVLAPSG